MNLLDQWIARAKGHSTPLQPRHPGGEVAVPIAIDEPIETALLSPLQPRVVDASPPERADIISRDTPTMLHTHERIAHQIQLERIEVQRSHTVETAHQTVIRERDHTEHHIERITRVAERVEPEVHIHIGRIVITAPEPQSARKPAKSTRQPRQETQSLSDFLERRR